MTHAEAMILLGIKRRWWCHGMAAFFALFVAAPFGFMAMDRADPVTVLRYEVIGKVTPGGRVGIVWDAISSRPCTGEARSFIIDSNRVVHDYAPRPTVIRSKAAERGTYSTEFDLPKSIATGRAERVTHVKYYCNALQRLLDWPIRAQRSLLLDIVER